MKAIQITEFGGPEVMQFIDLPAPVPTENEDVLTVTTVGINFADTHQTENSYLSKQLLPLVPGIEVVGFGSDGNRYLAAVSSGGYAQFATANKALMFPIPDGISDQEAIAMLVQGTTAWHILKTFGRLTPGETVVIHAAAGGVGTVSIQLAKLWGAKVIAVTSTSEKAALATSLGADFCVDAKVENLAEALIQANGGKRVDIVLEMVGGKTFDASLEALAIFGRVVTYGMASRVAPQPVNPGLLMAGSKSISGFWLSHCFGKRELLNDVIDQLFKLILNGELKPVIGEEFPLSKAGAAHSAMLARKTIGKVTLNPGL